MHIHIPCRPNVSLEYPPRESPQPLGEVLSVPLFLSRAYSDRYIARSIQLFLIYITTFHVTSYLSMNGSEASDPNQATVSRDLPQINYPTH